MSVGHKLEDLSGLILKPGENPYSAFIEACHNNHAEIQNRYSAHREKRNSQQRARFLTHDFQEVLIDQYLVYIERPDLGTGILDDRSCMTIWARPPNHVLKLAAKIQESLKRVAPNVWLMPSYNMHLTVIEVAHSRTPEQIDSMLSTLRPLGQDIVNHTFLHRARLLKPMISYDLSGLALTFLPASSEPSHTPLLAQPETSETVQDGDSFSYHHLRRNIFNRISGAGIEVDSRYQVPSAHITLGRFITQDDHDTLTKREKWVQAIDDINAWLVKEVWEPNATGLEGEWVVGQERGLDWRVGTLWYGGGRTVMVGEGF